MPKQIQTRAAKSLTVINEDYRGNAMQRRWRLLRDAFAPRGAAGRPDRPESPQA